MNRGVVRGEADREFLAGEKECAKCGWIKTGSGDADPVSYTHLDVYKRQKPTPSLPSRLCAAGINSVSVVINVLHFETSSGLFKSEIIWFSYFVAGRPRMLAIHKPALHGWVQWETSCWPTSKELDLLFSHPSSKLYLTVRQLCCWERKSCQF